VQNSGSIRLIASDMDGTLLHSDGHLSVRTVAAIEAATRHGIHVAAATGRSHLTAAPRLAPAVPSMRWAICSNGATLYDLHEETVVQTNPIADHHLAALMDVWERDSAFALGWEADGRFGANAAHLELFPALADGLYQSAPQPRPPRSGVLKILVSHPEVTAADLLAHVRTFLPPELEVATSGAPFVEVTAAGVHKGSGVAQLAERLGVSAAETMVFGDNNNDLPMFAWAGHAIAMANATAEAHAAATGVAAHHAEDGVARVIESLITGPST
jgi:Cof subfamily protein (haloacid dehalogenase superfamily)